jgi:hypothetical protein
MCDRLRTAKLLISRPRYCAKNWPPKRSATRVAAGKGGRTDKTCLYCRCVRLASTPPHTAHYVQVAASAMQLVLRNEFMLVPQPTAPSPGCSGNRTIARTLRKRENNPQETGHRTQERDIQRLETRFLVANSITVRDPVRTSH